MKDEQRLHDIGEGRLSEATENNRAILIGTYTSGKDKSICEGQLDELKGLCDTYGLEALNLICCSLKKIDASTFIGSGKVEEIALECEEKDIGVVIFDDEIHPHQQRNLEKVFNRTVIDRTELILGVFLRHAKTKEAKLQISLALYRYQLPRLRRMWTHLSRQRVSGAGGGYLKGVGEKQIEVDRRLLRDKISLLQKKIEEVKKQRETMRAMRKKSKIPAFAIIGYTNAGKSTLLNALTDANVLVEDKLFATLDTTTRKFSLPNKQEILLIDTVGFIRKIPHTLVAAFRSTLEEVTFADILLHLVDVANPKAEEQAEESIKVLKELKADTIPIITVLNKVDNCSDVSILMKLKIKYPKTVEISALKKEGFNELLRLMMNEISLLRKIVKLKIPQSHYQIASRVIKEGRIISQEYEDNDILIEAEIPKSLERTLFQFIIS